MCIRDSVIPRYAGLGPRFELVVEKIVAGEEARTFGDDDTSFVIDAVFDGHVISVAEVDRADT